MKAFFSILIIALFSISGYSQSFGKVDKSDLLITSHPLDSAANASYLLKKATAFFDLNAQGITLVIEHHKRIKVYKEKGETYGEIAIRTYRDGSTKEKVTGIKAMSFNLENGKVVKTKLDKKDIFNEDVSDNIRIVKFAMPNVKAGTVIDVKYSFKTPYVYTIPRFDFQTEIPVDKAEYIINIPSYYTYTPIPTGFVPINVSKKEVFGDYGRDLAHTFTAVNVPAMLEDDYVLDIEDYRSSLKYDLYSSQFPGNKTEYYSKDWNEIATDLKKSKYFGKELRKKTKELEPFINSLSSLTDEEKIEQIYSYVQNNYSWNKDYGISKDGGINKLLKNKTGNIGDINLLLINMLVQAGIDAKPFLTKPRHFGLLNVNFPSRTELSYLLAYIQQGEEYVLLDATAKHNPLGQLPKRAINISGILVDEHSGTPMNIYNPNTYKATTMASYDIDTENVSLIGKGKGVLDNYAATVFREEQNEEIDEEEEMDEEEEDNDEEYSEEEIILEDEYILTDIANLEDLDKKIKTSFEEKLYGSMSNIDDKYFINAALDFGIEENPFYEKERDFPIFFSSLVSIRHIKTINIPEGYIVESVPENSSLSLEDRSAKFSYSTRTVNNSIIIDYSFNINNDTFLAEQYPNLKEFYNLVINKGKEKIILTKDALAVVEKN